MFANGKKESEETGSTVVDNDYYTLSIKLEGGLGHHYAWKDQLVIVKWKTVRLVRSLRISFNGRGGHGDPPAEGAVIFCLVQYILNQNNVKPR